MQRMSNSYWTGVRTMTEAKERMENASADISDIQFTMTITVQGVESEREAEGVAVKKAKSQFDFSVLMVDTMVTEIEGFVKNTYKVIVIHG